MAWRPIPFPPVQPVLSDSKFPLRFLLTRYFFLKFTALLSAAAPSRPGDSSFLSDVFCSYSRPLGSPLSTIMIMMELKYITYHTAGTALTPYLILPTVLWYWCYHQPHFPYKESDVWQHSGNFLVRGLELGPRSVGLWDPSSSPLLTAPRSVQQLKPCITQFPASPYALLCGYVLLKCCAIRGKDRCVQPSDQWAIIICCLYEDESNEDP